MKNIKWVFNKFWKAWIWLSIIAVSLLVTLVITYTVSLWAVSGFDPYFFYSDTCIDLGGVWNNESHQCEGSESYDEWKERTIW